MEKNSNGIYDVRAMQLNTGYLKDLVRFSIKPTDVEHSHCYSYDLVAWAVGDHLFHDKQDIWTRSANFYLKTTKYKQIYGADLIKKSLKWQLWLELNFKTYYVTTPVQSFVVTQQPGPAIFKDIVVYINSPKQVKNHKVQVKRNDAAERALASVFAPEMLGEAT